VIAREDHRLASLLNNLLIELPGANTIWQSQAAFGSRACEIATSRKPQPACLE
jgi:hypothetical protein